MVTLKQLAEATGFSINTVSRALRDSGYVSPEARECILSTAAKSGYVPNLAARKLRGEYNRDLALIMDSHDTLNIEKAIAIKERAARDNYTVSIHFCDESYPCCRLKTLLADIRQLQVAGVIFIGNSSNFIDAARTMPSVLISYDAVEGIDCAYVDRRKGVFDAVAHLHLQNGCKRIAYLHGNEQICNRLSGYRDAVKHFGLPELIFHYKPGNLDELRTVGVEVAAQFKEMSDPPDGIQCSDYLAAGLLEGFRKHGIRVPEDCAIFGFDNRDFAALLSPRLSSVAQPNREIGIAAVELLLRRLAGYDDAPQAVKVPMRMVIRESTN